ncbi:ABC transporter substrate-binding protein [Lunatimonas salinarum]|uniref:ABC transporter substrate-binding protein n=1 Tax=Lunatimonas salinarum TaxID=1774590 RepID=UPI001FD8319B|nr:ABC transporter substrate-binding protein [Lunatimonas salinarum]
MICWVAVWLFACDRKEQQHATADWQPIPVQFAEGFSIRTSNGAVWIEIHEAFPNATRSYHYLVLPEQAIYTDSISPKGFDAVITLPSKQLAFTSTTHIPHLELLDCSELLAGFPNTHLISSQPQRQRIEQGLVKELGKGDLLNIESVLDLSPDWIMVSTLGKDMASLDILSNAGISVILNGDYIEKHPLGVAEWIKVTGALTGQLAEATRQFEKISDAYAQAETLVINSGISVPPKVMSGVMYNDSWYAPGAESWVSVLLDHAGGDYLLNELEGKGSLPLSYEYVLDRAEKADFWIGAADYTSRKALLASDSRYQAFLPFQSGNIYTYTAGKGATGGLLYFELGYARPDLVLRDLIKIIHPELMPEHVLYFYEKLNEN